MEIILIVLLYVFLVISMMTIPFNIPGTFLMAGFYLLYQLLDQRPGIDWKIVGILLAVAVFLELIEFLLTAWGSRKYGASRIGTVGAIVGSIVGAIVGSGMAPLVGTLLGAFAGAFIGAFALEYLRKPDFDKAMEVGKGALFGAVGGKISKIIGAIALLIIISTHL